MNSETLALFLTVLAVSFLFVVGGVRTIVQLVVAPPTDVDRTTPGASESVRRRQLGWCARCCRLKLPGRRRVAGVGAEALLAGLTGDNGNGVADGRQSYAGLANATPSVRSGAESGIATRSVGRFSRRATGGKMSLQRSHSSTSMTGGTAAAAAAHTGPLPPSMQRVLSLGHLAGGDDRAPLLGRRTGQHDGAGTMSSLKLGASAFSASAPGMPHSPPTNAPSVLAARGDDGTSYGVAMSARPVVMRTPDLSGSAAVGAPVSGRSTSTDARPAARPATVSPGPGVHRSASRGSLASAASGESFQSFQSVARPRAPTALELHRAELVAIKQTQGWVLEAITYVGALGVLATQGVVVGNLVVTGALFRREGNEQLLFTVQRIALLACWAVNILSVVIEDGRGVPRGVVTRSWWPVTWVVELWFLLAHGWRGFSALQPPTTDGTLEPLCRTCDVMLPLNFAFMSVCFVLFFVYVGRAFNSSDADVYQDALARLELPDDTRWRRLLRLLGRDRVLVGTALVAALVESGVVLLFNVLWGTMINAINVGDRTQLNELSEALGFAALGVGVAVFAGHWCSIVAGARLVLRLQHVAFGHFMQERPMDYIEDKGADALASIVNAAAPGLKTGMTVSVAQAIEGSVTCVVVIVYLAASSWRLTLIALGGAVLPLIVSALGGRWVGRKEEMAETVQEAQEELASHYLRHTRILRETCHETLATQGYARASVAAYDCSKAVATSASALNGFNVGVLYGVFVFVFWVGGHMSIDGDISVGFLVSCALLAFQLIDGVGRVASAIPAVNAAVDSARRVLKEVGGSQYSQQAVAGLFQQRRSAHGLVGHLKLCDVSYSYPRPRVEVTSSEAPASSRALPPPAVQDVALVIQPGERVALVGQPGCGKSTLLMLIQGMHTPTSGQVMVDGQDVDALHSQWFRSQLALGRERPSILRGTIGSNIALGVAGAEASAESVEAAARTVEAHEWISALPLGYDTPVMADDDESDDDVGHNSYHGASATSSGLRRRRRHLDSDASGDMRLPFAKRRQLHDDDDEEEVRLTLVQRQFIGLARIAIKKPRICLLDNATSYLPERTAVAVHMRLASALPSTTTVVVSRRLRVVQTCRRIVVMHQGRVVQVGDHTELMNDTDGVYASLVCGVPVLQPAAMAPDAAAVVRTTRGDRTSTSSSEGEAKGSDASPGRDDDLASVGAALQQAWSHDGSGSLDNAVEAARRLLTSDTELDGAACQSFVQHLLRTVALPPS